MARDRDDIIQEISYWKSTISKVDSIPLNSNVTYKDENDIYERLTAFVKDMTENVFGVYTNENGELVNLPEDEKGTVSQAWLSAIAGKITPLADNWYEVALKGGKNTKFLPLPQLNQSNFENPQDVINAREGIKNAVHDAFFPAYRALRDSFEKRPWYEWIFNHRQYVAERDSLKVMTSLITSMTGYTKKELNVEYGKHREDFNEEEIENFTFEYSNREVHINEPEANEELFKDEKRKDLFINVKKGGRIERVEGATHEAFTNEERYDGYFEEVLPMDKVLDIDYDEIVEEGMTAEEKLGRFDDNENKNVDEICIKFMNALKTNPDNEDEIWRALHIHMYEKMHDAAKSFCMMYDTCRQAYKGEKFNQEFAKITKSSAKHLFQTAFKVLGEEDSREIVKTVNGKEVIEKVGGSLFGIKTLKDRIVCAQKIANIILVDRSPVGFYHELSGDLVNTSHLMEKADVIKDYIKANYADKYGESEITTAIKLAKNEFDVAQRGEKPITSYVFEIGYRPDPSKIAEEKKALGYAQKMIVKGLINDGTIKDVINANVSKWKVVSEMQKPGTKHNIKNIEKNWIEKDRKLAEAYKDYDATATESVVESAIEQYNEQKKEKIELLKVDLQEKKTQIVPPVEKKPVEISAPNIEK